MGEKQNQPFQLSFNASLKIDFQGSRVTSDGGLILVRELDDSGFRFFRRVEFGAWQRLKKAPGEETALRRIKNWGL
jgi:hypothetical protein